MQKLSGNKKRVGDSADDHFVKEVGFLRKVFYQFIFGHPDKVLTLPNVKLVGCNHLRFEKELLKMEENEIVIKYTGSTGNTNMHFNIYRLKPIPCEKVNIIYKNTNFNADSAH